jgi:hypothetical protein
MKRKTKMRAQSVEVSGAHEGYAIHAQRWKRIEASI